MKKRIAINGFGRIGRLTFRALLNNEQVEVVAVNDLTDIPTLVHLLKYDTAHRKFDQKIETGSDHFSIAGKKIMCYAMKEANLLPWKDLNIDIVLECTGINLTQEANLLHLSAGAKKVIISAPPKDNSVNTYVIGVNEDQIKLDENIISNASCTTNCLAPLMKIIDEKYGIEFASMNTIHAYTQDQRLQDAPHKDLRRARAAAMNVIPTTTGAAKAVEQVYPTIKGRLFASSYRVPVITGSLIELLCILKTEVDKTEVNQYFNQLSKSSHLGIVEYSSDPLVSTDIIGNSHSSVFDSELTEAKGNKLRISAWYDNEAGYSNRLADMCVMMASKI